MWLGCNFLAWLRLLVRNRFAVHWSLWYIAAIDTIVSLFNSSLGALQALIYGRRVARTPIPHAPLFIIGHWRTGTTFLHELLILDERHNYPTTYQCFAPNHFLLTGGVFPKWLPFLMPKRRPMDNMAAGWDRPQEDEFALCMMGQPSPYLTFAFPNHPPQYSEYLDLENLPPKALASWKKTFLQLMQRLTFKNPNRLILKSPPHTCRIKTLLELFPDARFVHIVRDPYVVFPSTVNLWKSLYTAHGLQRPTFRGLEEHVFSTFLHFYERLEQGRKQIEPRRFYELRYEDLIHNPVGQMRALYDHLDLGGFEKLLPRLENYLASIKNYATNRYELPPAVRDEVGRRWGEIVRKHGYSELASKE
jgi:hypothetical protein